MGSTAQYRSALSCDADSSAAVRTPGIPVKQAAKRQGSFARLWKLFDKAHRPGSNPAGAFARSNIARAAVSFVKAAASIPRSTRTVQVVKTGVQYEIDHVTGKAGLGDLRTTSDGNIDTSACLHLSRFSWQDIAATSDDFEPGSWFTEIVVSQLSPSVFPGGLPSRAVSLGPADFPSRTSVTTPSPRPPGPGTARSGNNRLSAASPLPQPDGSKPSRLPGDCYSERCSHTLSYRHNVLTTDNSHFRKSPPTVASESFPNAANPKLATNGSEPTAGVHNLSDGSSSNLSGFVCNVHGVTGREPPPLVGASTTVIGDKLYVFGGRRLSRRRPHMVNHLYELDLIRRHWTRLVPQGRVPSARYFHSMCALGDTKLVCYGGMAPTPIARSSTQDSPERPGTSRTERSTTVMSDIHIYDIPTGKWTAINTTDSPPGRYAHCAAILPSSAVFTSVDAPKSAIKNNPASSNPNQGSLGVAIDGRGGAEMVVVGGQDSSNRYIEQIAVFNLRSLTWTTTSPLGRSCGAYRSVVTSLNGIPASSLGAQTAQTPRFADDQRSDGHEIPSESSVLIYSNYNFTDVKLELQIMNSDGSLVEKTTGGSHSPPGLRFPNGGVIDNHFIVSGTFLTSTRQEYALWALDLTNLTWSRVDVGGNTFSSGSWNRGVLWNRRNAFVALGDRKRSLAEDYNQRRLNFKNLCVVELEAFGLFEDPKKRNNLASAQTPAGQSRRESTHDASAQLGRMVLDMREAADMELLTIGGERIPVNSLIMARRWGPYFTHLMHNSVAKIEATSDGSTLTAPSIATGMSRNSLSTITPSIHTVASAASASTIVAPSPSPSGASVSDGSSTVHGTAPPSVTSSKAPLSAMDPSTHAKPAAHGAAHRSRLLFLPHTHLTLRAVTQYLYTGSLPPANSDLCTPQILCSLLQLARPYHIDGLLEATVARLHQTLDVRNTPAIFNAAAMAAGGGAAVRFEGDYFVPPNRRSGAGTGAVAAGAVNRLDDESSEEDSASSAPSTETSDIEGAGGSLGDSAAAGASALLRPAWTGGCSSVIGLQKRGLRGLMEGRKMRERTGRADEAGGAAAGGSGLHGVNGVGLGIG